jgi:hypothetical protein
MRTINLTNEKKRDAQVCMEAPQKKSSVRRVLDSGVNYANIKLLKQNLALVFETLSKNYADLTQMGNAIIAGDPEIDMEAIGKKITGTQKLYLDQNNKIVYRVNMVKIIKDPSGGEKERHDLMRAMSNVTGESIVQWSGRKFPKGETIRKFVFQRKVQIKHLNLIMKTITEIIGRCQYSSVILNLMVYLELFLTKARRNDKKKKKKKSR